MKENEDIEEAVVTVHKMTEDEKMRRLADLREKAIMDEKAIRRKGYEDGMLKGRTETQRNMAKKLKDMGMNAKDIEKVTELSIKEIEKL